jgi:inhibitor of cysteine peptidase
MGCSAVAPVTPAVPTSAPSASVSAAPPSGGKTVKIGEADGGKTIDAHVGDTVALTLETNPSTGYDWQVDSVDKTLGQPKIERPEGPAKAVGAATTMTFSWSLASKSPLDLAGDHEVVLGYRRPWEKDDPPEKTFKFKLRIAK